MIKHRTITLLVAFTLLLSTYVYAAEVSTSAASAVAKNFFYEQVASARGTGYQNILILEQFSIPSETQPDYRIFNFQGGGWVIVSADDVTYPIVAYGTKGAYVPGQGSPSHLAWMEQYRDQISYLRTHAAEDASVSALWERYLTADVTTLGRPEGVTDVEPLFKSTWGQGKYYNAMCPADPTGDDGHALVGCVATSMSQIMYYYRHPAQGVGTNGYYANNSSGGYGDYGYLFVNFAAATYDWDGMNNTLNGSNANLSVAELCYHAGVSVNMAFGPTKSGSQTTYTVPALKNNFQYSSSVSYLQRAQYSTTNWENIIKAQLDSKKPLIYSGTQAPPGGGHAWNLDGYQTTANGVMFHCNWGWDGMSDGYYSINSLAPGTEPPFLNNQGVVINIYPAGNYPTGCSSTKLVTHRSGSIDDGSSLIANYENNMDCYWLIHPEDSVTKIYLNFSMFDVADDGDVVTIYNGETTSAPVLGTFKLSSPPAQVVSTSSKMLVRWTTNGSGTAAGWQAYYTTSNPNFCSSQATHTAPSGTISDGSGAAKYSNNVTCAWLISPSGGGNLTISFTNFDVAEGDYINVYDWGSQTLLLNKYSGTTPPPAIVAPSGAAYIEFKTDWAHNGQGWEATYTLGGAGIEDAAWQTSLQVYPQPARDQLTIDIYADRPERLEATLMDITGRELRTQSLDIQTGQGQYQLDVRGLRAGVYLLQLEGNDGRRLSRKIVVH
ncbi:MAG TPA: C10 family peptidase [Bacteroidales bacterium]|nr:C10 family peptidase [Bacteroidales bacterium]